ncbi:MAG: excinuclease ABC subunit UvrA [Candidatus Ancillula trichonymphae]|jgi:excinuclease ABC subunit A|nr:excinuclease ABC subunit UvrA [Candidatus Ancillula trichonymphae]
MGSKANLRVKGARVHNLNDVDIEIPREKMVVFTGVSGSGKSSLAFDTIFAEGQRRYVESLSAYARQFLGQMNKPDVDFIEGLSPAVSIDQKSTNRNSRSTVGTITEIYDYLRLLYARAGTQHCPVCDEVVRAQPVSSIVDTLLGLEKGTRVYLLAPVVRDRKGEWTQLLKELKSEGFTRFKVDGKVINLYDGSISLVKTMRHNIDVVVDRLVINDDVKNRLQDSIETAVRVAKGKLSVEFVDVESDQKMRHFSTVRACPNEHELELDEIEPRTFSFNAPYGACSECTGIGYKREIDPELLITDENISIVAGALTPINGSRAIYRALFELADEIKLDLNKRWRDIPTEIQKIVLYGHENRISMQYRNRWGRIVEYSTEYEGIVNMLHRRYMQTTSKTAREYYERFMRDVACFSCEGARLKPEVLAVKVSNKSISDVTNLSISDAYKWISTAEFTSTNEVVAKPIVREISARLEFLINVGLNYLTLARSAGTLSGGEAQRIRLATQVGSGLTGVLYVLDEPSIGLHQRDNERLISTLNHLRKLGNTLIIVEHDEDTINEADWIVDIGPGAGVLGGNVVYCGPRVEFEKSNSLTADYISGRKVIAVPKRRRKVQLKNSVVVNGASENNLKNITVGFPLGVLTVVTGVSGSGKSTLVNNILYRALAGKLNGASLVPGKHKSVTGAENLGKVIHVDQGPIGRTPRSNPATYTSVFTHIRDLFAATNEAKARGYGPGRFSFNVKGGRCQTCEGDGTIRIEMNFLPDVYVNCETCKGERYNRETLEIKYNGKAIADVLNMSIEEACAFFNNIPTVHRLLQTLVDVGLGYVRLGQSSTTLSGGESQRVKLATELGKNARNHTVYILDEPTSGLHFDDINKLLQIFDRLVDQGNTVIVIEHNLDVIKCADYIIDMGPEGGEGGGKQIANGSPEELVKNAGETKSSTAQFLKTALNL